MNISVQRVGLIVWSITIDYNNQKFGIKLRSLRPPSAQQIVHLFQTRYLDFWLETEEVEPVKLLEYNASVAQIDGAAVS
jgi:hypothetical protein